MRHRVLLLAVAPAIAFTVTAATAIEDDPLFRVVNIENSTGLEVGRGFDILTGNPRADCVDRSVVESHSDLGPSSVTFRASRVENSEQLDRSLNISASASASFGGFGANASASYGNTLSVSSFDLTYVVEVKVTSRGASIRDVALKDQFAKLIANGQQASLDRFRAVCGDGFVGEFTVGGELRSIIKVHTRSKAETEAVSASLGASFSMISGSASLSTTLKKIATTNQVDIWTFQKGGSGPLAMTPDELATKAAAIPDNVKAAPSPVEAAIFSYITVLNDPTLPLADFSAREKNIMRLGRLAQTARDQFADARYIFDHMDEFFSRPNDIPDLAAEMNALEAFRKQILEAADACAAANGVCKTDFTVPAPIARPARR